ncbi:MAG TPA: heme lyase CcmF/NrfE family subunit, partial [Anaerolineales bacterium]|nr:heme lyase CcmF/NrfE family subunit [Anaerolineales bacterium]
MLNDIGLLALLIGFGLTVYATAAAVIAGLRSSSRWAASARNATCLAFPVLSVSVIALEAALLRLDFRLAYVADVSSQAMSPFLRATALWGGQQGSILFWGWMMSGFVAACVFRPWKSDRELFPWVMAVAMLTTAFFVGLSVFITNPWERYWLAPNATELTRAVFQPAASMPYVPSEGEGLNPLLRHFGMIGHPPTTYLGFTGFVVPYAFAVAALITGKGRDDGWIRATRRWTLIAWMFLSVGLVLGGRWAYDVLGWGGFWGWDPVENAMLMPWLTGTAFLHSVMITEKRGMLKVWSMILIILTYALALFGTFITRTGVIGSVHAFAKSALGPAFFLFIGLTFLGSLSLLFRRLADLRTEHDLESSLSREAAFLLQNVLFLAITFAVLWGTIFPMISELATGTKMTVGPPYFKQVTGPMFFALLILMALAPLLAWRRHGARSFVRSAAPVVIASLVLASTWAYAHRWHPGAWAALWLVTFASVAVAAEFVRGVRARMAGRGESPPAALARLVARNPRRYGGYIVHLGVAMIALAFVGDAYFKQETQGSLAAGEQLVIGGYRFVFEDLTGYPGSDGRDIVEARASLYRGDTFLRPMNPRRDFFVVQEQPVTVPAVYSTPAEDVYVLLVGWEEVGLQSTTFRIYINPFINMAWAGGVAIVLGVLLSIVP